MDNSKKMVNSKKPYGCCISSTKRGIMKERINNTKIEIS